MPDLLTHAAALGLTEAVALLSTDYDALRATPMGRWVDDAIAANEEVARRAILTALLARLDAAGGDQPWQHREAAQAAALVAARQHAPRATLWVKGDLARIYLNTSTFVPAAVAARADVPAGWRKTGHLVDLVRGATKAPPRIVADVRAAYHEAIAAGIDARRDAVLPPWWREYIEAGR
jgi:hypothetical protein